MLDIYYPDLESFKADCKRCGYNWRDLLQWQYVINSDGSVSAIEYI